MDKKGKLVMDQLVTGIFVLIVVIAVIVGIYGGVFVKTREAAGSKLPTKEALQNMLKKFTTIPGELEIERQQEQANKIVAAIFAAVDKMKDANDCIEEVDFSDVNDRDFVVEFGQEDYKTKIDIYKIINKQKAYTFSFNLKELIHYFVQEWTLIDEFKISDELRESNYFYVGKDKKEKIKNFLYKNKYGKIGFFSENLFNENYRHKQICSSGEYFRMISEGELMYLREMGYKRIIMSESKYTLGRELDRSILTTYVVKSDKRWYPESDPIDMTSYNDKVMATIVGEAMKLKFKVDLEK